MSIYQAFQHRFIDSTFFLFTHVPDLLKHLLRQIDNLSHASDKRLISKRLMRIGAQLWVSAWICYSNYVQSNITISKMNGLSRTNECIFDFGNSSNPFWNVWNRNNSANIDKLVSASAKTVTVQGKISQNKQNHIVKISRQTERTDHNILNSQFERK